jgi:hypothetical protein
MARKSLSDLKAAFGPKENTTENNGFWDKFYPFFKMGFDQTATVRFLPDQDEDNPMGFLVENLYHKLTVNGREKSVACLKMFGESCPCCELSQKYYNGEGVEKSEDMGKKYWRKIDYVGQVLVLDSPIEFELKEGENPARLISLGPKIFKLIRAAFQSGDLEDNPCDLTKGYDFRITKSKQGEYADYSLSKFAPRASSIPEDLLGKIELYDLKHWRFKKVDRATMEAMIEADRTGGTVEDASASGDGAPALKASPTVAVTGVKVEAKTSEEAAAPAATGNAADILARIRARQAK